MILPLTLLWRELRQKSRSGPIYWTRFGVALAGTFMAVSQLSLSGYGPVRSPGIVGYEAFNGMAWSAFVLCCASCLLAADGLGREQREGTLGLLFLTRVSPFDVVLGKLGSSGLTALCALLAFLPVMVIPLLTGGVAIGEAARKGLALLDILFLALAIGLWAASSGRDLMRTIRSSLFLLAIILLVPGAMDWLFWQFGANPIGIGILSPMLLFLQAGASAYQTAATPYWVSLVVIQGMAWLLLIRAGFRLRRVPLKQGLTGEYPRSSGRTGKLLTSHREQLRGYAANPIQWLVRRQRSLVTVSWSATIIWAMNEFTYLLPGGFLTLSFGQGTIRLALGLVLGIVVGIAFSWIASRFFVEARHTGELELLLTTPLGARTIVSDQWQALKDLLRGPVLLMLAFILMRTVYYLYRFLGMTGTFEPWTWNFFISFIFDVATTLIHIGAYCWLGMWFGIKARNQISAVIWTVSLASVVPGFLQIILSRIFIVLANATGIPMHSSWLLWVLPEGIVLGYYLGLIYVARHQLTSGLKGGDTLSLRNTYQTTRLEVTRLLRRARNWPSPN